MAVALTVLLLLGAGAEAVILQKLEDGEAMYKMFYPGPMDFNCTSPPLGVSV